MGAEARRILGVGLASIRRETLPSPPGGSLWARLEPQLAPAPPAALRRPRSWRAAWLVAPAVVLCAIALWHGWPGWSTPAPPNDVTWVRETHVQEAWVDDPAGETTAEVWDVLDLEQEQEPK
jgi:hypothetical protein